MKKTITITILFLFVLGAFSSTAQKYPKLIKVEGGTFTMGNQDPYSQNTRDERPTHEVTLSDFYIGKTEVTVGQYKRFCKETGKSIPEVPDWGWNDKHPIVHITWQDAMDYCAWLSEKLGKTITLPTEAQWEYAAKGGNKSKNYKFSGSNSMLNSGWYKGNAEDRAHKVAAMEPNELGIYDMNGNVWEWCLDWYAPRYYTKSKKENPLNLTEGPKKFRSLRGCSYANNSKNCRLSNRFYSYFFDKSYYFGFRVVSNE